MLLVMRFVFGGCCFGMGRVELYESIVMMGVVGSEK